MLVEGKVAGDGDQEAAAPTETTEARLAQLRMELRRVSWVYIKWMGKQRQ
jgi:hypothetical protein